MLETVVPDVHLVATLMSLSRTIPEKNKETARQVVRKVVDELLQKLSAPTQQAVTGALNRSSRRRNPRYNEIDWKTTITKNLKNYQPEYKTIIPEIRIGYGRKGDIGHLLRHFRSGTGFPTRSQHPHGGIRYGSSRPDR